MKLLQKIAILSVSIPITIATAAIAPSLSSIHSYFYGASPVLIKLIVTLPALICIPMSLALGIITKMFNRRSLLIFGTVFYTVFGLVAGFSPNIWVLILSRALMGLGLGILSPLSIVIISDFFKDDEEAKFIGYASAVNNIASVIATLLVGVLTEVSWRLAFVVYLSGVIVLIILILWYPKEAKYKVESNATEKIKINPSVYKYAIVSVVGFIVSYAAITNISLLLSKEHLGSPSLAGILLSLITVFGFLVGLIFNKLMSAFKEYLNIVFFALMAIGFLFLVIKPSLILVFIGIVFIGIGFGLVVPMCMFLASQAVLKEQVATAIGIVTVGIYAGEFISPVAIEIVNKILHFSSIKGSFYSSIILSIISIIVYFFEIKRSKKKMYKNMVYGNN